jgi:four helix bundle protein
LKELRESLYWLKLVEKTNFMSGKELRALTDEANELIKIVAKSVITAKGRGK